MLLSKSEGGGMRTDGFNYTTQYQAAHHRFAYWNDIVLRHCIPSESIYNSSHTFTGELKVQEMGLLDVCSLKATRHSWVRKASHLRASDDNDIWLGFFQNGRGQLEQNGRQTILEHQQLVIYDAAQTFRFDLEGENHLIRVPRHLLSQHLPNISHCAGLHLQHHLPGVLTLRCLVNEMVSQPPLSASLSEHFSTTLIDLLVMSLSASSLDAPAKQQELYSKMRLYIRKNLADPSLNVEKIAGQFHVSSRTVTRIFTRHNETPAAIIWQERLQASFQALSKGKTRSVSQTAMDYGFSDFSHFSHAFRKRFGISPNLLLKS